MNPHVLTPSPRSCSMLLVSTQGPRCTDKSSYCVSGYPFKLIGSRITGRRSELTIFSLPNCQLRDPALCQWCSRNVWPLLCRIQKAKLAAGGLPMEEDPPLPPSDPPPVPSFAPDLASDPPPPPPPLPPSFQAPAAHEAYDPFAAAEPQRGGPDSSSMAAAGGELGGCPVRRSQIMAYKGPGQF